MIEIDIEKKMHAYEGHKLLKVSAQIEPGSIVKVSGPSGSGKTTLLKIIAGLIDPEKGKITVGGQYWLDRENQVKLSIQKRHVGLVFQSYALFPHMTVKQHLDYATKDKIWISRLLHYGRLETLQLHKPEHLSGGQQQRLAILRALAIKPRLLLMDEPFSALDVEMRISIIDDLKDIVQELKATCLIVSHNPVELDNLANQEIKIS